MPSVFEVADRFVDEFCELRPTMATLIGLEGHDHEWGDTGLAGIEAQKDFGLRYRDLFAEHVDDTEFLSRLAAQGRSELSRSDWLLTTPGTISGTCATETLMGELGYLDDFRYHFGMLAKQMYRAARVVVDVGLHLEKRIADSSPLSPGESWSFDTAVEFMRAYGFRTPAQAEAEVLRYLGWPGQAIAYKLGESEILSIREDAQRRLGSDFDLKSFHKSVLNHGTMRLDLLREISEELLDGGSASP